MEPIEGHIYRIRTKHSMDRYEREHVLTYLGGSSWDARPNAGTQYIAVYRIIEDLGLGRGRTKIHYMNKVIRENSW